MSEEKTIKSLASFGYGFNENGQLRQLEDGKLTDKGFEFEISESQSKNQKHYEELGEVITEHVYELLEAAGLKRVYLDQPESQSSFVFASQTSFKDIDKLLILIHGSGVVRAGQWARRLIINDCLDSGTMLPYIKKAQEKGFDILITNTNDNKRNGKSIEGSGSPESHGHTVWKKIVQPSNAKSIAIVAHSAGGFVTSALSKSFQEDFKSKVFAVAFTDSWPSGTLRMNQIGINFVASDKPLGTPIGSHPDGDMRKVSAGHANHEWTSYACIDALFDFLDKQYDMERESAPATKKTKSNGAHEL